MIIIFKCLRDDVEERAAAEESGVVAASPAMRSKGLSFKQRSHLLYLVALIMAFCLLVEMLGLIKLRWHYSLDLWLALVVTALTARSLWVRKLARWILRPHLLDQLARAGRLSKQQPFPRFSRQWWCSLVGACGQGETDISPTEQLRPKSDMTAPPSSIVVEPVASPKPSERNEEGKQAAETESAAEPGKTTISSLQTLTAADRALALHMLRGSRCALRYLSFDSAAAFDASMQRVAS